MKPSTCPISYFFSVCCLDLFYHYSLCFHCSFCSFLLLEYKLVILRHHFHKKIGCNIPVLEHPFCRVAASVAEMFLDHFFHFSLIFVRHGLKFNHVFIAKSFKCMLG